MYQAILTRSTRRQQIVRAVLIVVLGLMPLLTRHAPAHAQAEATPILLGEFTRAVLLAGNEAAFTMMIPADGIYTVVYTGADSPESFVMTVIDTSGDELYSDAMPQEVNLDLTAGEYLFLFAAQEKAELGFVVGIEDGSMTTDRDAPGQLFNGATFLTENVTEPLYAIITVEPSPYPQQMGVLVQGADGDIYQAELMGETFFDYTYITTDTSSFLRMITSGGDYELAITPLEGGEFLQVSVFLSGPAPVLEFGVETEGELTAADDTDTYQLTVEEAGTVIEITAVSDEGLDLSVGFKPGESNWSAYTYSDEPTVLRLTAPEAGIYYVELKTDAEAGAAYTVLAEKRGRAARLELNKPITSRVLAGASIGYIVEVSEPEYFLLVVIVGADDSDIDLAIRRYKDGEETAYDSSRNIGSREIVALYSDEPAEYFVTVDGGWIDNDAGFVILASNGPVAELLAMLDDAGSETTDTSQTPAETTEVLTREDGSIEQWVADAEASSEYSDDDWSARQIIGEPDTLVAGDEATAWAALNADAQLETLLLSFAIPVIPTGIEIYETYNPGAVVMVEVLDPNTDEWVVVWEGVADTPGEEITVFSPPLVAVDFATNQVRLTIDEPSVPGWNEIDAVKLIGIAE